MMLQKKNIKPNIKSPVRFAAVMISLTVLLVFGLILNINIGSVDIGTKEVFSMIGKSVLCGIKNIFSGGKFNDELSQIVNSSTESQIIFSIRMPRMLLAAILGGALSVSGFLLQTFFRNPIAGPFVLGISSGAKMLVGITLIFLSGFIGYINPWMLVVAAFFGSLVITMVVVLFSGRVKNMSMLLVIGIMVGYICSAITDFCITFANDHDILNLTGWSMGTFSGADWESVVLSAAICIPAFFICWLISKPMEAYSLGEGYAKSMGISIKPFCVILILLSSILSATVTAIAGPVSFVGIAVPHITRTMLKSSKPYFVIPASFVMGAVFCVFCDLLARTVFAPTEMAISTVTSIFGAPIVIYIMVKRKKQEG